MKRSSKIAAYGLLVLAMSSLTTGLTPVTRVQQRPLAMRAGTRFPFVFESNRGQTDARARFLVRRPGYAMFLADSELVFSVRRGSRALAGASAGRALVPGGRATRDTARPVVFRMTLLGATWANGLRGERPLAATVRGKRRGKRPAAGSEVIPAFSAARYRGVYPGVDLVVHDSADRLRYDFEIDASGNPAAIRVSFPGADAVALDSAGNLVATTAGVRAIHSAPHAYQRVGGGTRSSLSSRWVVRGPRQAGFEIAGRTPGSRVVIDPEVVFATFLGGLLQEEAGKLALDNADRLIVAGTTASPDFPDRTAPPATITTAGVVARFDFSGAAPVMDRVTFIEGDRGDESFAVAATAAGDVYVAGTTESASLMGYQAASNAVALRGFVARLDANLAVLRVTFVDDGSSEQDLFGLAVDVAGGVSSGFAYSPGVYVAGSSTRGGVVPLGATTPTPAGNLDAFVVKLDLALTAPLYRAYLGGAGADEAYGVDVRRGVAYVVGGTGSTDFPTLGTPQAAQPHHSAPNCPPTSTIDNAQRCSEGFVAAIDVTGTSLVYATYACGPNGGGLVAIAVDAQGQAMVTGWASYANSSRGTIVRRVNATGTVLDTPVLIGRSGLDEGGVGIRLDQDGRAFVTGTTHTENLAVGNPVQTHRAGYSQDAFLAIIDQPSALTYLTYLGGTYDEYGVSVALGSNGAIFVGGITGSPEFPGVLPTANATQPHVAGDYDMFVVELSWFDLMISKTVTPGTIIQSTTSNPTLVTYTINLANGGLGSLNGRLTDILPPGFDPVIPPSEPTCSATPAMPPSENATVVCTNITAPASGANLVRAVTIQARPTRVSYGATACNVATFAWPGGRPVTSAPDAACTTVLGATPQLVVTKTGPVLAEEGRQLTWTVVVKNTGEGDAPNVHVLDTVAKPVVITGATSSQGTCVVLALGTGATCDLQTLPARATPTGLGGKASITITGHATAPGRAYNFAQATTQPSGVTASANSSTTIELRHADVSVVVHAPTTAGGVQSLAVDVAFTQAESPPLDARQVSLTLAVYLATLTSNLTGVRATVLGPPSGVCRPPTTSGLPTRRLALACVLIPGAPPFHPTTTWQVRVDVPSTIGTVMRAGASVQALVTDPRPLNNCMMWPIPPATNPVNVMNTCP